MDPIAWLEEKLQKSLKWLADSVLMPFFGFIKDYFKWWFGMLMVIWGPIIWVLDFVITLQLRMIALIAEIVIPDVGAVTSGGARMLATANHWFPLDAFFVCLAAWLVLWCVCAGYRFLKSLIPTVS